MPWLVSLRVSFEIMAFNPGLVFKSALPGNSHSWLYNWLGICRLIFQPNFVLLVVLSRHRTAVVQLIKIHTLSTPSTKVESTLYTSQLALWCLFEYVLTWQHVRIMIWNRRVQNLRNANPWTRDWAIVVVGSTCVWNI